MTTEEAEQSDPTDRARELVGTVEQLRGLTIHCGVSVGIVDCLDDQPRSADAVVEACDLDPDFGGRLLTALRAIGIVELRAGTLSLTPVGERYTADHPESVRDFLMHTYDPDRLETHPHLPAIVQEGGPDGYVREHGHDIFEHIEANPTFADRFNGFQASNWGGHAVQILALLDDYGLAGIDTVCDVGGGRGVFLAHLLEHRPELAGILVDLPTVVADTAVLEPSKRGLDDRCTYIGGDMFESVPPADAYWLSAILHDWDDEACVSILETIYQSAPADGTLFVYERVGDADDPTVGWAIMDVWMMLEVGGRERTYTEFETLFDRAGWRLVDRLDTENEHAVLVGAKR